MKLRIHPFYHLPLTFHVKQGVNDPEFVKFKEYYDEMEQATT